MSLTNFDRWRLYMDGFVSPDNYINWGWYYMISAALQRRVWIGPDHSRLYPNIFVILVGEPGVGKGLVIKQVSELLRFHKLPDPTQLAKEMLNKTVNAVDRQVMEDIAEADYKAAQEHEGGTDDRKKEKKQSYEKPLLFPVAADASTYEALVKALSKSLRRINYKEFKEEHGKEVMAVYTHSSLCFCLEEISSLFRKKSEDLVHFLIQAYDCGDYTYDTKTQGKDRVKRCCLNFFGGTTPGFMQATFDDRLLTEGFASRTFFIFAARNRKATLWVPELNAEQKQAYQELLTHLKKLAYLYGRVEIDNMTRDCLEEWWKGAQNSRPNSSVRLNPYYSRKNIHVLKLAMAHHFGESTEMKISYKSFEFALNFLAQEERNMHLALGLDNSNPIAAPAKKILKFLETFGRKTKKELFIEFFPALPKGMEDLDAILEYLIAAGKIKDHSGQSGMFYTVIEESANVPIILSREKELVET